MSYKVGYYFKDINNLIHFFSICLTITKKDQSQCFEEFKAMDKALIHIGMENEIKMKVYQILAAIPHLGNIVFVDNSTEDGCMVADSTKIHLCHAARLLEIRQQDLEMNLLTRKMNVAGSEQI